MGLPDGYKVIRFLDKCYIFIDVQTSYDDAKQRCEQSNLTMVNIDNNQEMEFIASVLDELWIPKSWLGITFSDERDSWVNTDGWFVYFLITYQYFNVASIYFNPNPVLYYRRFYCDECRAISDCTYVQSDLTLHSPLL